MRNRLLNGFGNIIGGADIFGFDTRQFRCVNKGLYVLLSRTQAGPGRTVKQEQEEISRNHVQTFIYLSVRIMPLQSFGLIGVIMVQLRL